MVGGILPSPSPGAFYETWLIPGLLKYDQLVHFGSSGVVTVALWQACGHWCDPQRCRASAPAVLSVPAGPGLGALNEGFEFLSALRFPNYVGGPANTGWGLVFNFFGAATTGVFLACSAPPPPPIDEARSEASTSSR